MNRISRKAATIGAVGLLALAGLGTIVGSNAVHAAGPPAVTQPAADPDQLQQNVQSTTQSDLGGADKPGTGAAENPESGVPTAPETDTIQSQSQTDTL